jgi:hypothetical protein
MAWWRRHTATRPAYTATTSTGGRYTVPAAATVLASATLVTQSRIRSLIGRREEWQSEAWEIYKDTPEIRSGVNWASNACSRARLYVGKIDPDGSSPPTPLDSEANDLPDGLAEKLLAPLHDLGGGQLGQGEMLRRLSLLLNVPGESYLVGWDDVDTGRRWIVASPSEVSSAGTKITLQLPDAANERITLGLSDCTVIRIWRPDAEYAHRADSPLRALRTPARVLQRLDAHTLSSADSRLKGPGLLAVSETADVRTPAASNGPNPIHDDSLTASLVEAASAALKDSDSAAAHVPITVRVHGAAKDAFHHLSFDSTLDDQVLPQSEAAIRRIAIGLDIPPEQLLGIGLSGTNHWGGRVIEETGVKLHIEPQLGMSCEAFTYQYYWPAIEALGVPNPREWAIWYDTSDVILRPDRGPEASQAHERGVLSDLAYIRELGFSRDDMPDEEEKRRRLLVQVATGNPQLAPAALAALGVELPGWREAAGTAVSQRPVKATPALPPVQAELPRPSLGDPEPQEGVAASAVVTGTDWRTNCLDMAVQRALSRAGQWLLNRGSRSLRGQYRDVPLHRIHVVLGAEQDQLDQMLAGAYREFITATPEEHCLHQAIDHYVRALLLAREDHHRDYLARAIQQAGCDQAA